ncbi:cytidine deaminase [bacterium]|nr:cytidine deaminase [bacterium]
MKTNEELLKLAQDASKNAYSIYSRFSVGACALYSSGNCYIGCNVENASYGLSLCAERNAISTAIAAGETGHLVKIAIYSPNSKNCLPCGACRQWFCEFEKGQEIEIILQDDNGCCSYKINDLMPYVFKLNVV